MFSIDLRPFVMEQLSDESAQMARVLIAQRPDLKPALQMTPGSKDKFELFLTLESPTNGAEYSLILWMDEGEPGIIFGSWHTHGGLLAMGEDFLGECRAVAALIDAILSDRFVIAIDIGGKFTGFANVLDLRELDSIAEELTSRYSPGRFRIVSWGGTIDREWSLEDINI